MAYGDVQYDELYEELKHTEAELSRLRAENACYREAMFESLQVIARGLLADGLDVRELTPVGRHELRMALDSILNIAAAPAPSREEP